jgi:hypothetical protein
MADSLDRWLAAELPRLVERAQQGALADAEAILRRRLTEALVNAAGGSPAPVRSPAAGQATEPSRQRGEPERTGSAIWVYGVVPGHRPEPAVAGVGDGRVDVIREASLAALVTEVDAREFSSEALERRLEDLQEVELLARAHERVLEAALQEGDVLPFRMATLYESDQAVRRMLVERSAELHSTIERLTGKAEWGVKAFLDPAPSVPAGATVEAASGTDYIARRRAARDDVQRLSDAADAAVASIHAQLEERASAARLSPPQDRRLTGRDEDMVLNGAYLVPRGAWEAFAERIETLREQHAPDGLTLELTGPWPPYHFVGGSSG